MKNPRLTRAIPLVFAGLALLVTTPVRADIEGRWKISGDGSCMFDANDDGPNQCSPTNNPQQPGRWKIDGSGGCSFDPNDSGPNQCTPTGTAPGRWKVDGSGACVFDSTDSGPNQCNPPAPVTPAQ